MDARIRNRMFDDAFKAASMLADELKVYGDNFTKAEKNVIKAIIGNCTTLTELMAAKEEINV